MHIKRQQQGLWTINGSKQCHQAQRIDGDYLPSRRQQLCESEGWGGITARRVFQRDTTGGRPEHAIEERRCRGAVENQTGEGGQASMADVENRVTIRSLPQYGQGWEGVL